MPVTASHAGIGMMPYSWNVILGATQARKETTEYIAAVMDVSGKVRT